MMYNVGSNSGNGEAMKGYICPVCKRPLALEGKSYVCEARHTFDIAKEGYVNLAVGKSGDSGDSKEMCLSRHRFLNNITGGYKDGTSPFKIQILQRCTVSENAVAQ